REARRRGSAARRARRPRRLAALVGELARAAAARARTLVLRRAPHPAARRRALASAARPRAHGEHGGELDRSAAAALNGRRAAHRAPPASFIVARRRPLLEAEPVHVLGRADAQRREIERERGGAGGRAAVGPDEAARVLVIARAAGGGVVAE